MSADLLDCKAMMAAVPGLSYMQLHRWTEAGHLHPSSAVANRNRDRTKEGSAASPGQGYARLWPACEVEVAQRMVWLTAAGIKAERAHDIARSGTLALTQHVTVSVS